MTLDERVADWKENHYIGVFTQALIVDLQLDRLPLLGQISRERIINAELVIERDCIKSQRDELVAALAPFVEYIKHPTQPIHAVIRPEEWDAAVTAFARVRP